MDENKTLAIFLKAIYNDGFWWISAEAEKNLNKIKESGDVRAQMVFMVEEFKTSPVVVNSKGMKISFLRKENKEPIKFFEGLIKKIEASEDISEFVKVKLENEFYNTKEGVLACCYRALGHIYSGKWGKIPLEFKKGKECYAKADELTGVESYETKLYSKEAVRDNYRSVLRQQIGKESPNDYIRKSARQSGINPYPTDPDLHAEASGKKD